MSAWLEVGASCRAACRERAGGKGHTVAHPAKCDGDKRTDLSDSNRPPPLLVPGDVKCPEREGVALSSGGLYREGEGSDRGLAAQAGRELCWAWTRCPRRRQPSGIKEREINASHSLRTAGTYIHLIALHNGFHKPLIIRLYLGN